MSSKTFAIITDIHSNITALIKALSIIDNREKVDQLICLGDCFALGPEPEETLKLLKSLDDCIFIKGNYDRYIIERLWEQERPSLEGMDPDDPICQSIVANIKWTAEQIGQEGVDFVKEMHIAHRQQINNILVEFTHAWYQRDDVPPSILEAYNWRSHVKNAKAEINRFIFVHGHIHIPRFEERNDLTVLCQGATGLSFDEDTRGSVAFLTVGHTFNWDVVRYKYDHSLTIQQLEDRKPPFYHNLQDTIRYASIRNDQK